MRKFAAFLALGLACTALFAVCALAFQSFTVNGVAYSFPDVDDQNWGQYVTNWAAAVSNGTFQKNGGTQSLTSELYFGSSYGIKSKYFGSDSSNIATAGSLRLAVGDLLNWRNNANTGNLSLGVDGSDNLTWNGNIISTGTAASYSTRFIQNTSTLQSGATFFVSSGTANDLYSSSFSVVSGTTAFRFRPDKQSTLGSVPMLAIDNNNASNTGLKTYFADVPGGQRTFIWDAGQNLPNIPQTGKVPTFAVYGDILVGDIVALQVNPMTYFIRASTGLAPTATTTLFSARAGGNDTDGGAQVTLAPSSNSTNSDGYISLLAYGQGSGAFSNTIRLLRRTGVNTSALTGYWDTNGNYTPASDLAYDWGTSSARLRKIYSGGLSISTGAGTSGQIAVVSTGTTNLFEVNGASIVMNVPLIQNNSASFIKVSSVGSTTDGLGTTNTAIRQFFRIDYASGTDISFASSTTLGSSITIHAAGTYGFDYCDEFSAGNYFGLSFNSAQLTTGISTISNGNVLGRAVNTANATACMHGAFYFNVGDIIRPHGSTGAVTGTSTGTEYMYIYRIR